MRYSRLGESGLIVSRFAFGAMTLGTTWTGVLGRFDAQAAGKLVHHALDGGVTFFDTADVYHLGESETLLGQALGDRRDQAVISTKVGMRVGRAFDEAGLSARHIHRSIDGSLRRLGTDRVDVYICHRPDRLTPLEETLTALDAVVRAGKARYLGFSNWPAWLAAKAVAMQRANGLAPFVTGQMYYSLVGRDIEDEYVPFALDAGIGTMAWSPLAGGFLTGRYTEGDPTGGDGRLNQTNFLPLDRERGKDVIAAMRAVAEPRGVTLAAVALAWLAAKPTVATVVMGFSSTEQFDQNLAAADLILDDAEVAALDAASAPPQRYPAVFLSRFATDPAITATAAPLA